MLNSPHSSSILQAVQAPYFRRFGYNVVESVRNKPDLYFTFSDALELTKTMDQNGQTPNQFNAQYFSHPQNIVSTFQTKVHDLRCLFQMD
ncbi:hypothetical protein FGIG_11633 [Fasciola gigantica]|uniref:Uncharacterized protein n=1 Tax=Fasciola gigantica TaxID=46835 RepID=A0A504YP81_FASGI|nr:hypothetical protein FGIG_11633 [Fasciola gigantica]